MSPCIIRGQRQGSNIFHSVHVTESQQSHTGLQLFWSNKRMQHVTGFTIFTCRSVSTSLDLIALQIPTCNVALMLHNAQVLRIIYFSHSQCHLQFASLMLTTQKVNALFLNKT